jgi:ankyrin repeat protein
MFKEMKKLMAEGVQVSAIAPYSGGTALHTAASRGLIRSVEFLLEAGAELNTLDGNELTPLMCACSGGQTKGSRIALRLMEAGADVSYVRRSDQMTALMFAVNECTPQVIQALIDRGAVVDGPAEWELTALMLAARANNVETLKVLVKNGADLNRACGLGWAEGRTAEGLAEMEGSNAALAYLRKARDASGSTSAG